MSYYITLGKSQESDTFITKYNVEDLIIKNFIQKFINIFESVTNIDDLEVFKNIIQYTYNIIDNLEIKKPSLDPKMQIILTKSYHDSNGRTHYLSSFEDKDLKINISMILLLLDGTNEFLYIPADNFFEEVFYKILLKKLKIDRHYKEKYANLQQGYKNPEKSIKILNLLLDDTDPNYKQETLDILLQKCLADQSIFDYLNEKKLLEPEKLYAISIRIDKKYLLKDVNQMIDNYKKDNNLE